MSDSDRIMIRVPREMTKRIRAFAKTEPLLEGNQSRAVRVLIERGLEAVTRGELEGTSPATKRGD
jgi:hypothetical protein